MSNVTGAYSIMQAAEWGVDGCLYCYSSFFLLSCGLTNTNIGICMGVASIGSFFAQILFGEALNRQGRSGLRRFLLAAAGILLLGNVVLLLPIGRLLAVTLFLAGCMLLTMFPAFLDAASMYELQRGVSVDFGIGRGTGSLGYAVCSALVGRLLLRFGTSSIFCTGAVLSAVLIGGILWFFAAADQQIGDDYFLEVPTQEKKESRSNGLNFTFLTAYPRYTVLLTGCVLLMMGHTYTSNFLYQIISHKGGDEGGMGLAAAIAACAEVPVLFLFGRISHRLRCDQWLKLSALLLILKMALGYWAAGTSSFLFSELFQSGYALYVVSSVYYTGAVIPHGDVINGQAYLHAASTLGVLLSLLTGGAILDYFGVQSLLFTGVIALVIGTVITFLGAEPVRLSHTKEHGG
ncbi:MAG: MFS transporter [Clostridiales bacterium]|nr:MFS transporter [Clostridiales bacterium]